MFKTSRQNNKSTRLNKDTYNKPSETYTERLTKDDIKEQLKDYVKVDDIKTVPLGTHLRYFTVVGGKQVFRLGGYMINNNGLPNYIVLSNGKMTWSVQTKNAVFFRKLSVNEIKKEVVESCKQQLKEKDIKIAKLIEILQNKSKS
jgi:hypothetical protein